MKRPAADRPRRALAAVAAVVCAFAVALTASPAGAGQAATSDAPVEAAVLPALQDADGPVRLIVDVGDGVTADDLAATGAEPLATFEHLDQVVVEVSSRAELERLSEQQQVRSVGLDRPVFTMTSQSRNLVGQPAAAAGGATGAGQVIAVLDTGITPTYFGSCSTLGSAGCSIAGAYEVNVPAPAISGYTSSGSAADGQFDDDPQNHGSRVSMVALASAPSAKIAFIDVFARYTCVQSPCPYGTVVLISSDSMIAAGVDKAIELRTSGLNIHTLNLSAGSADVYAPGTCPSGAVTAFSQLRANGILGIVAAGNGGRTDGISSPACLPTVLAVGATYDANVTTTCSGQSAGRPVDGVACFSNSSPGVALWAPGSLIEVLGTYAQGTSFSAPFVAGAAAALWSAVPAAPLPSMSATLTSSGPVITDTRNGVARHRLAMADALGTLVAQFGGPSSGGSFTAVSPVRALDTRPAPYGPIGTAGGSLGPAARSFSVSVPLGVDASQIGSVALNITGISPSAACYLTVWPSGAAQPYSSNLNLVAGQTLSNSVVVGVGGDGRVAIAASCPSVEVAVDVTGWFPVSADVRTVAPQRIVDTRPPSATGVAAPGPIGELLVIAPLGSAGLPSDPSLVDSVLVNVTVDGPSEAAYLTIWPSGSSKPYASSLNFSAGETATNFHIAKLGPDGRFAVAASNGVTHVIVDVFGWVPRNSTAYRGVEPQRILDTRYGAGVCAGPCSDPAAGSVVTVKVTELAGVPAGAKAVALKVTAASATEPTYLTLFPAWQALPNASNLFVSPGHITPNLVTAKVGAGGYVAVYNAAGSTSVVLDIVGYYS